MNDENSAALGRNAKMDGVRAADMTAKAFEAAGDRIAAALSKAAASGELSFNSLAESITRDLAKLAIEDLLLGPLQSALGGGGVASNTRSSNITMNVNGVSDARSFQRSQGQISAALARAVNEGQRFT